MKSTQRSLSIHEHHAMELLKSYNVPVPKFGLAKTAEEASKIAQGLNTNDFVVKAQVLAGGRGKGSFDHGFRGGVHVTFS